jgi:phage antirepressor YoqD-like protein
MSMTSQEIADLVGSRHDSVRLSIDRLVDRGVIQAPPLVERPTLAGQTVKMYVFEGEGGKRDSIIAVAQLSPEFTAKLVDRWQELEAQVAKPATVDLTDAASLRGLLLGYTEQVMQLEHKVGIQAAKIAEDKPKADYYEHVREAKNTETIGDFAKILGFGRNKLFKWLREQKILMGDNMPQQKHIDHGHFRVLDKEHTTDKGKKITYKQTVLTGKGKTYIQKRLKKAGKPDLGED